MQYHESHATARDIEMKFDNFDDYIIWRCRNDVRYQYDFVYSSNNRLLVDFVGKYESIQSDFDRIRKHIGLNISLPVTNVSKIRPYQEYYSSKTISLVQKTYHCDIEAFEYEFNPCI